MSATATSDSRMLLGVDKGSVTTYTKRKMNNHLFSNLTLARNLLTPKKLNEADLHMSPLGRDGDLGDIPHVPQNDPTSVDISLQKLTPIMRLIVRVIDFAFSILLRSVIK